MQCWIYRWQHQSFSTTLWGLLTHILFKIEYYTISSLYTVSTVNPEVCQGKQKRKDWSDLKGKVRDRKSLCYCWSFNSGFRLYFRWQNHSFILWKKTTWSTSFQLKNANFKNLSVCLSALRRCISKPLANLDSRTFYVYYLVKISGFGWVSFLDYTSIWFHYS